MPLTRTASWPPAAAAWEPIAGPATTGNTNRPFVAAAQASLFARVGFMHDDARGRLYAPVVGGGTGPASLARTGFLRPGQTAQARLAFLVPKTAGHLTLVFEPVRDGSLQVRVPLRSDR